MEQTADHAVQPKFNIPVGQNGYAWWYADGLSDDGQHGFTVIAMIGSVFSPYYAAARRNGVGDPLYHVAMNVALYGAGGKRWALTERGRSDLTTSESMLRIGPSEMTWDGTSLTIVVDEITVPFPRRIRGTIKLIPTAIQPLQFALDSGSQHFWQPIAPIARAEVNMTAPALNWHGHAYFDHNRGTVPLETTFQSWHWSRANTGATSTIFYDVTPRIGLPRSIALEITRTGRARAVEPPPVAARPSTGWLINRATRSDTSVQPHIVSTLEDTPFYARSIVSNGIAGIRSTSMHESLNLDRFRMRVVQAMLPFRMPRRAR